VKPGPSLLGTYDATLVSKISEWRWEPWRKSWTSIGSWQRRIKNVGRSRFTYNKSLL